MHGSTCENCKSTKIEAHCGDDGVVRWFCRRHHQEFHYKSDPNFDPEEKDARFLIWVHRSIREMFYRENNKGGLVNELLEKHYTEGKQDVDIQ